MSTEFHTCSCQQLKYPEHLSVTASSPRAKLAHTMEVISTEMLTPAVKHLVLGRDYNFKFKPGQWYVFSKQSIQKLYLIVLNF